MPFRLCLFRADEGLGSPFTWDREHREPLGTRDEVKAALDQVLRGIRWSESGGLLFASGPFDGEEHAYEITLFGQPDDTLLEITVYSRPPAIRAIMTGLDLNYCYAQETGDIHFPLQPGDAPD